MTTIDRSGIVNNNDSPEAWRDMVACMRDAVRIAKQADVVLAFEPEVNNVVDSAKKSRRLMDEIGSPHLKVAMDGANIFHAGELARLSESPPPPARKRS